MRGLANLSALGLTSTDPSAEPAFFPRSHQTSAPGRGATGHPVLLPLPGFSEGINSIPPLPSMAETLPAEDSRN